MAALLAAGGGSRFRTSTPGATHKLLAELHGRPLWRHSLDHLLAAGFERVVLVTGAAAIDPIGVTVVHNPNWASGQASSVQAAVSVAVEADVDAIVIGLADQPFIGPDAWRAVADAPPECDLVVATYDGRRGPNPVRIGRALWPLLPADGDEGARGLLARLGDEVCTVACVGSAADIDTLEDLERWTSS
jgi:CTP:molybdopterin cytidylyltransferase MocA